MIDATTTDTCVFPQPFDAELGAVIITGGADDPWLDAPRCPWFAVVNAAAGCPFGTFGFPTVEARERGIEIMRQRGYTHFVTYLDACPGYQHAVLAGGPMGDPFTSFKGFNIRKTVMQGNRLADFRVPVEDWRV